LDRGGPSEAGAASLSEPHVGVASSFDSAVLPDRGAWAGSIGLDPAAYGTHSMRRTKPTLIYRRTRNLRAVQLLLGHTKLESTVRYLGIEVDDALEIAEQTEV
jgi:integrase